MIKAEKTNEIIKALECCSKSDTNDNYCDGCPYDNEIYCASKSSKDALDLINRQQAEIELYRKDQDKLIKERTELKAEIERLTNNKCEDCAGCTQWLCDCSNERAQAIKEYTEKLIFEIVNRPAKANPDGVFYNNGRVDRQNEIIDIIQELASHKNTISP